MIRNVFLFAVGLLPTAACSFAETAEFAEFHAHRATFGTDTATVDDGQFEIEFGVVGNPREDALDTPTTIKYGLGATTEGFVDLSPYVYERVTGGDDVAGFGDMVIGVRHRFVEQSDNLPSVGLQIATKLPTGDASVGGSSGELDFFVAAIATKDFDGVAATLFYELGVLGDPGGTGTDLEHSFSAITEFVGGTGWGVFGEIAGNHSSELDAEAYFANAGVSFNLAKDMAWDCGLTFGLNSEAPNLELFVGFTKGIAGQSVAHHH